MYRSFSFQRLSVVLIGLFLVACQSAASAPTPTVVPATAIPPTEVSATAAPPTAIPPTLTATGAAPTAALFKGIVQGVTSEGYLYLGNPSATVTLYDYSDFL
jgi:hypothetical protein